jgi:hypothetical protein
VLGNNSGGVDCLEDKSGCDIMAPGMVISWPKS